VEFSRHRAHLFSIHKEEENAGGKAADLFVPVLFGGTTAEGLGN
jgi:hypothetical protein